MANSVPSSGGSGSSGVTAELEASFQKMIREQADIAITKNKLEPDREATRTFK